MGIRGGSKCRFSVDLGDVTRQGTSGEVGETRNEADGPATTADSWVKPEGERDNRCLGPLGTMIEAVVILF